MLKNQDQSIAPPDTRAGLGYEYHLHSLLSQTVTHQSNGVHISEIITVSRWVCDGYFRLCAAILDADSYRVRSAVELLLGSAGSLSSYGGLYREIRDFMQEVVSDRHRQVDRWGRQLHYTMDSWMLILGKGIGDMVGVMWKMRCCPSENLNALRIELVRVTAVMLAMLEAIEYHQINGSLEKLLETTKNHRNAHHA